MTVNVAADIDRHRKSGDMRRIRLDRYVDRRHTAAESARAEAEGTAFRADALLPEPVGLEDTDLMSVLSNLLDNALDAAREAPRLSPDNPRIKNNLRLIASARE